MVEHALARARRVPVVASDDNIVPLPQVAGIDAEAAAWIARLDSDEVKESDRTAFQAWCESSHLHQEAADRLSRLWSDMSGLRGRSTVAPRLATGTSGDHAQVQP